ncbi:MAG: hypothetical protein ACTS11_02270 [Roseicyclus sp.]
MGRNHLAQIDALTGLLERENAGLEAGDIAIVGELLDEKTALAAEIEAERAAIAEWLQAHVADAAALRRRVERLRQVLDRNDELVGRMALAIRDVTSELARIAERDSLSRVYDATGAQPVKNGKKKAENDKNKAIDKSC